MKNFLNIAGVAIILVLAILFLQQCEGRKNAELSKEVVKAEYTAFKAHTDHEISLRNDFIESQDEAMLELGAMHAKEQERLKTEINRLKRRRLPVTSIVADYTCLEQVVIRDSIITAQDSLILDMSVEKDSIQANFAVIRRALELNILYEHKKFTRADELVDSLLNIPEKKKSPLNLSLSGGYGLIGNENRVSTGFFFGPSISYRLQLRNPFKRKR